MEIVVCDGDRLLQGPQYLDVSNGVGLSLPGGGTLFGCPDLPMTYQVADGRKLTIRLVHRIRGTKGRHQIQSGQKGSIKGKLYEITPIYKNRPVAEVRAEFVEKVKALAFAKINALLPEWKQRNLTARAAELAMNVAANRSLSQAEKKEWEQGRLLFEKIKKIRLASDDIEAEIQKSSLKDLTDFNPESHGAWPI